MKIIQLKYFKAVCEYSSVSKAAESLSVTQPAITIAIRNLEEEFGVSLFKRNSNKFELTEAGNFLLKRVDVVLLNIEKLEQSMKDLSNQINTVKLGIPPMIGAFMFSNVIYGCKNTNPNVNIEVTERGSLEVAHDVENGSLDMGIVACKKDELNNNIQYINLLETEFQVVVDKNHRLANKSYITIEDLKDEQIILFNKGSYQYKHIIKLFEKDGITPKIMLNSYQLTTINECLKFDNCVAFMYKDVVPMLRDVVGISLDKPYKVNIGLIYNTETKLTKSAESFKDFCINKYSK